MIVHDELSTNELFDEIETLVRDHQKEFYVQISGNQITLKKVGPGRGLVVTSGDSSGHKVDNPLLSFPRGGEPRWSTYGRSVSKSEVLEKVEGWLNE